MTDDEIIAVVTAHRDGKTVQCRLRGGHSEIWVNKNTEWDFSTKDYRVKPEPREWWAVPYDEGISGGGFYASKETALGYAGSRKVNVFKVVGIPE